MQSTNSCHQHKVQEVIELAIKKQQLIASNKERANLLLSRMLAELKTNEDSQVSYITIGVKNYE